MKSLAIYYKKQNPEDANTPEVELHINIWKVEEGGLLLHPSFYIDFGLCVPFSVDVLRLYLPFKCECLEDFDLGHLLEKRKLLGTVFNDDYSISPMDNHCYHVVKKQGTTKFYLYKLGTNNLHIEDCKENGYFGSMLELKDFSELAEVRNQPGAKRYMRFRLKVSDIQNVVKSEHISNDLLQAAFSKIDLFDIRVNELREIHEKVQETALNNGFQLCEFSKIHLFYMADAKENIVNGGSLQIDSRMLEESQWAEYEPKSDLVGVTYIAHHWNNNKKKNDNRLIDSFTLFFGTIYPSIDAWRLLAYFITVVFTGALASFLISDLPLIMSGEKVPYVEKLFVLGTMLAYMIGYLVYTNIHLSDLTLSRKR